MMMELHGWVVEGTVAILGGAAGYGYNRARVAANEQRIKNLEEQVRSLTKEFVPRNEVQALLDGIRRTSEQTLKLVHVLLFSGDRDAALRVLEASAEDDLITAYRAVAPRFEGDFPFMYLDTAGLITWGIGEMSPTAADATRVPWRHVATQAIATAAEVAAEFARVKAMKPGMLAKEYFSEHSLMLHPGDIDASFRNKCDGYIAQLRRILPAFDSYPVSKQLRFLDMVFNLGAGLPPSGDFHGSGLQEYSHLITAALACNWKVCATECGRNTHLRAFDARNEWTSQGFLATP
jgi:hypothetical protein